MPARQHPQLLPRLVVLQADGARLARPAARCRCTERETGQGLHLAHRHARVLRPDQYQARADPVQRNGDLIRNLLCRGSGCGLTRLKTALCRRQT